MEQYNTEIRDDWNVSLDGDNINVEMNGVSVLGTGDGITYVSHDSTLTGKGTTENPLSVSNTITEKAYFKVAEDSDSTIQNSDSFSSVLLKSSLTSGDVVTISNNTSNLATVDYSGIVTAADFVSSKLVNGEKVTNTLSNKADVSKVNDMITSAITTIDNRLLRYCVNSEDNPYIIDSLGNSLIKYTTSSGLQFLYPTTSLKCINITSSGVSIGDLYSKNRLLIDLSKTYIAGYEDLNSSRLNYLLMQSDGTRLSGYNDSGLLLQDLSTKLTDNHGDALTFTYSSLNNKDYKEFELKDGITLYNYKSAKYDTDGNVSTEDNVSVKHSGGTLVNANKRRVIIYNANGTQMIHSNPTGLNFDGTAADVNGLNVFDTKGDTILKANGDVNIATVAKSSTPSNGYVLTYNGTTKYPEWVTSVSDDIKTYVGNTISTAISTTYKIQGSSAVSTLSGTTSTIGYVYNMLDAGTLAQPSGATFSDLTVIAGDNVVYTSSGWDKLSGTFEIVYDDYVTSSSSNGVKSSGIYSALNAKQNLLSFDTTPTINSTNPVTSGGIYSALSTFEGSLTTGYLPVNNPVITNSVAMGLKSNTVMGTNSAAFGYQLICTGTSAFAAGSNCVSTGNSSVAMGISSTASSEGSVAIGSGMASGYYSFASGLHAIAEGWHTAAIGYYAHAATNSSFAVGDHTYSNAYYSTALGRYTTADSQNQTVLGVANITGTRCLVVVGNGTVTSSSDITRSNAYTLDSTGNGWFAGNVKIKSVTDTSLLVPTNINELTTYYFTDATYVKKSSEKAITNRLFNISGSATITSTESLFTMPGNASDSVQNINFDTYSQDETTKYLTINLPSDALQQDMKVDIDIYGITATDSSTKTFNINVYKNSDANASINATRVITSGVANTSYCTHMSSMLIGVLSKIVIKISGLSTGTGSDYAYLSLTISSMEKGNLL